MTPRWLDVLSITVLWAFWLIVSTGGTADLWLFASRRDMVTHVLRRLDSQYPWFADVSTGAIGAAFVVVLVAYRLHLKGR